MRKHKECTNDETSDKKAGGEVRAAPAQKSISPLMDGGHHTDQGKYGNDLQDADHGRAIWSKRDEY